jgi:hypothetical protein
MNRKGIHTVYFLMILFTMVGCKKDHPGPEITIASISGTYALTGLTWEYGGMSYSMYDSLDACEKDNLIRLNSDRSANFIDAGTVCAPPEDDNGTWFLSSDSLYLGGDGTKIKSFDGKLLILTGSPEPGVNATTTLAKQ